MKGWSWRRVLIEYLSGGKYMFAMPWRHVWSMFTRPSRIAPSFIASANAGRGGWRVPESIRSQPFSFCLFTITQSPGHRFLPTYKKHVRVTLTSNKGITLNLLALPSHIHSIALAPPPTSLRVHQGNPCRQIAEPPAVRSPPTPE